MSPLKECIANNRLLARCIESQHSVRPVGQPCTAGSPKIEQDGPRAGKLTFAGDFVLEHSFHGPHIASVEISGCF